MRIISKITYHTCILINLPSISIDLKRKSTPTVVMNESENESSQNLNNNDVLPTPLSPMVNNLNK